MPSKNAYNNTKYTSYLFLFFVLSLLTLPSFFHGFFDFSSFAFGLFFVSLIFVLVTHKFYFFNFSLAALIFFFVIHLLFSVFFVDLNYKSLASSVLFLFVVFSAYVCSHYFFYRRYFLFKFEKAILWIFILFLFFGLAAVFSGFEFGKFFYDTSKPVFPFKEPSHYALAFAPLYGFFLLRTKGFISLCVFCVVFLMAFFAQSFLLLVVATSLYLLSIANKSLFIPVFFLVMVSVFLLVLSNDYYYERISIGSSSDNLTALVYLQGVQDAFNSIKNTYGLGLGFQMLGFQEPSYAHYRILEVMGTDETGAGSNRYDGGFLAAKIIAEFGIFGIIFSFYYLILMIKSCLFFLKNNDVEIKKIHPLTIFSLVCIISFSYEFFIRGMGYFTPGFFLFMFSFFYLKKARFL